MFVGQTSDVRSEAVRSVPKEFLVSLTSRSHCAFPRGQPQGDGFLRGGDESHLDRDISVGDGRQVELLHRLQGRQKIQTWEDITNTADSCRQL